MIKGILLGLTISIIVGPVFFVLLQATIERGSKAGFIFVSGVWLSDFLYMIAVFYGIAGIQTMAGSADFHLWMSWIGGILLLSFGIANLLKTKPVVQNVDNQNITNNNWQLWLKGFLINSTNPGTILFWVGPASTSTTSAQANPMDAWVLLISLYLTIVAVDLLKILFAKRLRQKMNADYVLRLRKISGWALILFGLFLICKAV
jgi:threonine/homoserine/homoserine lactone efflux protein